MNVFQSIVIGILGASACAGFYFGMKAKESLEVFAFTIGMVILYALIAYAWSLIGVRSIFSISDTLLMTEFTIGSLPLFLSYLLSAFAIGGLLRTAIKS